jgi:hypothetical protein
MKKENKNNTKKADRSTSEEARRSGGRNNASSNRGGTTDMDGDALTTGRPNRSERGSGMTTKRGVTGSDYDGQVA